MFSSKEALLCKAFLCFPPIRSLPCVDAKVDERRLFRKKPIALQRCISFSEKSIHFFRVEKYADENGSVKCNFLFCSLPACQRGSLTRCDDPPVKDRGIILNLRAAQHHLPKATSFRRSLTSFAALPQHHLEDIVPSPVSSVPFPVSPPALFCFFNVKFCFLSCFL